MHERLVVSTSMLYQRVKIPGSHLRLTYSVYSLRKVSVPKAVVVLSVSRKMATREDVFTHRYTIEATCKESVHSKHSPQRTIRASGLINVCLPFFRDVIRSLKVTSTSCRDELDRREFDFIKNALWHQVFMLPNDVLEHNQQATFGSGRQKNTILSHLRMGRASAGVALSMYKKRYVQFLLRPNLPSRSCRCSLPFCSLPARFFRYRLSLRVLYRPNQI